MDIRIATEADLPAVYAIRFEVFVDEQHVPADLELDEADATALHIVAEDGGTAVGCARLLLHGDGSAHIGRLAVRRARRGEGIGRDICRFCIEECRAQGCTTIRLHGQLQAAGFYEKLGFAPHGETFWEAGIEHREMVMHLSPDRENLALRPIPDHDLVPMTALWLNDTIKKTYMIPDFGTPAALEQAVRRFMALSRTEAHFVRGIYRGDDLIGFVNEVERNGACVELGYVVHPAEWGHGYATAALRAAMDELFTKGVSVIRAGAFEENGASLRVMEKCGMQRCAGNESIEYRGVTHTCIYYEMEAPGR